MRKWLMVLAVVSLAAQVARAEFIDLFARQDDVGENKSPRFGTSRILVLPVEVNEPGLAALPHDRLVQFFETESDAEFRFRSYFAAQSNGRFTPEVKVAPNVKFDGCPAELEGNCTFAGGDVTTILKDSVALLRTIFRRAHQGCFESPTRCEAGAGVDFSQFDQNGMLARRDGAVDGVLLVTNLTGVFISLPVGALNDAGPDDLADGNGGPFLLDDTKVNLVGICGDTRAPGSLPEHTCVREFGHLLGLPDFSQSKIWQDAHHEDIYGGLALSAMGDWTLDATAPFADAESRYRLQWTDVDVVSGTRTITLAPAASGGKIVKLGMMDGDRKEYFLVEARGPVGPYDRGVVRSSDRTPVYGLAVYHVDWSKGPTGNPGTFLRQMLDCVNCRPWAPFIMNVQADRRFDIQLGKPFRAEEDLFGAGASFGPSRDTTPFSKENASWGSNWYDGTPSGVKIENVHIDPDTGNVTADFTAPVVADACSDVACGPGQSCIAGNCRPPEELPEPKPAPKPQPKPQPAADEGWGCHAGPSAPAVSLIGILAVLAKRRRARREALARPGGVA